MGYKYPAKSPLIDIIYQELITCYPAYRAIYINLGGGITFGNRRHQIFVAISTDKLHVQHYSTVLMFDINSPTLLTDLKTYIDEVM